MRFALEAVFWLSLVAVAWPYTGYPAILWLLSRSKGKPATPADDGEPTVSVVIAAYNEAAVITERIENLLALDYPREKLQFLIVSDGSEDGTNERVALFADRGVTLLALGERGGKVNALNSAMTQVTGELVVFSDANTEFAPDVIRKLAAPFSDPAVGCVCGKLIFRGVQGSTSGEMEGKYWDFESAMKRAEGARGALLGANGGIFALRRDLWEDCPRGTLIEDFVIAMRVLEKGRKVLFEEKAVAWEDAAMSGSEEFTRRVRIGAGGFQAFALLWPMLHPARGFPAFAFLSRKVLRWFTPFFLLFALVSNAWLAASGPAWPYGWLFAGQVAFYLLALAGFYLRSTRWQAPLPLRLGGYFLVMNGALALGFYRWLTASQPVKWKRTPRRPVPAS